MPINQDRELAKLIGGLIISQQNRTVSNPNKAFSVSRHKPEEVEISDSIGSHLQNSAATFKWGYTGASDMVRSAGNSYSARWGFFGHWTA